MANRERRSRFLALVLPLALFVGVTVLLDGCTKKEDQPEKGRGETTVVALSAADLNKDGTVSDAGLQKIQEKASSPNLTVVFVRAPLTDAGLAQLGKFSNLRHVEAVGSRVTQGGVDKLKKTIPEVEVVK
jgi:hypothetical protein